MFRSAARVFIAALALSAVAHASRVMPSLIRQVKGSPSEAKGSFKIVDSQSDAICPRGIVHRSIDSPVQHSVMTMNGKSCDDGGNMTLLDNAGEATAAVSSDYVVQKINKISEIDSDLETVIYGFEKTGRVCSDDSDTTVELPEGSLVLILRSVTDTRFDGIRLLPRLRYMFIYYPDGGECVYTAQLHKSPTPSPSTSQPMPSTSASVSSAAEVSPKPSPSDSVPPPQASLSPSASMSGSASGGDDEGDDEDPPAEASISPSPNMADATPDSMADSTAEATEEPDDPVCFPADATVQLEDGSVKKMADVSIGDRVLVADGEYSDVFMFSHKIEDIKHSFVTLRTESGLSISATSGHYLYINGQLAAARTAKTGDTMTRANGVVEAITEVKIETKTGLYNPQTGHGDIIVNEIRASTFTQTVKHCTAQALLAPIRLAYKALGLSLNAFNNGADSIASVMPKGNAIA